MAGLTDRLARLTPEQRTLLERRLKSRSSAAEEKGGGGRASLPGLESEAAALLLASWKDSLGGLPEKRGLAGARQVRSGIAARCPLALPASAADALQELAERRKARLSSVLLAAFSVLLYRSSGRGRQVIGLPFPVSVDGDATVRLNPLPLCVDLGASPTFLEVLDRIETAVREAGSRKELPLAQLAGELRADGLLSAGESLLPVAFVLVEAETALSGLPPRLESGPETAGDELLLWLRKTDGDLEGELVYDSGLLESVRIEGLAIQLPELAREIAAAPGRRIADLPLSGGLSLPLSGGAAATRGPGLHSLFVEQVRRAPDAVAASCRGRLLTYVELDREAGRIARLLSRRGYGPESRVALVSEPSLEWLAAMLAVFRVGGTAVLLDPDEGPEGLADAVAETRPRWLLVFGRSARLEVPGPELLEIDLARPGPEGEEADPLPVVEAGLALICLASCPPGGRRWVMLDHFSLGRLFRALDEAVGCGPGDAFAVLSSPASPGGWVEVLWPLTRGAEVTFASAGEPEPRPRRTAGRRPMEFSLFYFANEESQDGPDKQRLLIEGARFADRHGFLAVWTPERHFHPFGGLFPNPAVTSAALAMITRQVRLRAGSVVMPLHHPIRVAEDWSLVDNFSGGRVGLAFASGWHANDFVFFPDHYKARREVMLRGVDTVRRLWRGEPVTALSGSGKEVEVKIFPRPVQPELPVWITAAATPGTFTLAGEIGVNVLTHLLGQGLERVTERIRHYRETRALHGQDAATGQVTLMLHTFVGDSLAAVRETVREPFSEYIRSFTGLIDDLARNLNLGLVQDNLSRADMRRLQEFAFERYFNGSGLFGTPRSCLEMIRGLEEIGVDEVACLIDFGVSTGDVLASLHHLDRLRELARKPAPPPALPAPRRPVSLVHLAAPQLSTGVRELLGGGSLRAVLLDGDAAGWDLPTTSAGLRSFQGTAETGGWSVRLEPAAGSRLIARPLAEAGLLVLGPDLAPMPIGAPGELCVQGEGLACGYLDRPDLTAQRFLPSPFGSGAGERLFRTGQAARYLPDGSIEWIA